MDPAATMGSPSSASMMGAGQAGGADDAEYKAAFDKVMQSMAKGVLETVLEEMQKMMSEDDQ